MWWWLWLLRTGIEVVGTDRLTGTWGMMNGLGRRPTCVRHFWQVLYLALPDSWQRRPCEGAGNIQDPPGFSFPHVSCLPGRNLGCDMERDSSNTEAHSQPYL